MKDVNGVERGKCNSCACNEYRTQPGSGSLRCDYCNHTPGEHVKIAELGACLKCGQANCDKYMPEEPGGYGECQYCGCDASSHAGAAQPAQGPARKYVCVGLYVYRPLLIRRLNR